MPDEPWALLGTRRWRHPSRITAIVGYHGGIASTGYRCTRIWDPETGELRSEPSRSAYAMDATRDGRAVVTASYGGIHLIDEAHQVTQLMDRTQMSAVVALPGGFAAGDRQGRLLVGSLTDDAEGHPIGRATERRIHDDAVVGLSADRAGRWIASVGDDGLAALHDTDALARRFVVEPHPDPSDEAELDVPRAVALSPDGRRLAVGFRRGAIALFEVPSGTLVRRIERDRVTGGPLRFEDDRLIWAGGYDDIECWDVTRGERVAHIETPRGVQALWLDREGDRLWCGMGGVVLRFRRSTLEPLADDQARTPIQSLAFAPDSKTLASCAQDGDLRLWEIPPSRLGLGAPRYRTPALEGATDVRWSPAGRELAVGTADGVARLQAASGEVQASHACFAVGRLSWSSRGDRIAALRNRELAVLSVPSGEVVWQREHAWWRGRPAWTADGTQLWVAVADQAIHRLDAATGEPLGAIALEIDVHDVVACHPDGAMIAITDEGLCVYRADGTPRAPVDRAAESYLRGGEAAGDRLATRSFSQVIIWDPRGLVETHRHRPGTEMTSIALAPSGRLVALGLHNGNVELWEVDHLERDHDRIERRIAEVHRLVQARVASPEPDRHSPYRHREGGKEHPRDPAEDVLRRGHQVTWTIEGRSVRLSLTQRLWSGFVIRIEVTDGRLPSTRSWSDRLGRWLREQIDRPDADDATAQALAAELELGADPQTIDVERRDGLVTADFEVERLASAERLAGLMERAAGDFGAAS
jgi:cytochrome c